MEGETVVITIRDGDPLLVSKQRLTADSNKFRYLIEELKYDELEMDDFSPDAVVLFLAILEDKELGEIEHVTFRELHKLAVVFEVKWLREGCRTWLTGEINIATSDQQKTFVFDECWFILKQWGEQTMMDTLISVLVVKDNSTFLSKYMAGLDKLETKKIDLMLILGGTDTDLFLHTILLNLSDEKELNQSVKYLLE